jgi:hypothetical protein
MLPELAPPLTECGTGVYHSLHSVNRLLRIHRAGPSTSLDELVIKERAPVYHIGVSMSNLMYHCLVESNHTIIWENTNIHFTYQTKEAPYVTTFRTWTR